MAGNVKGVISVRQLTPPKMNDLSHKTELLELVEGSEDAVLPSEIPVEVDEAQAVEFDMGPGDVSVHHPNIFHASDANTSDRWRRGLTIRYIPAHVEITDPDAGSPFLLRGSAVPGVNDYLPAPRFDPGQDRRFTRGTDGGP